MLLDKHFIDFGAGIIRPKIPARITNQHFVFV